MAISKPFYRIARPEAFIPNYVLDKRYAQDRLQLSRAYISLEKGLRSAFNYIEPDEKNKDVFSFELYALLLRACAEVELNCKEILEANGAKAIGKHFTMEDYKKLENSSLLSKYTVVLPNWRQRNSRTNGLEYIKKSFQPFRNFQSTISKSPDWYVAYNDVKHNREENLEKANLENCINAIAGVLVLLYSQFGANCVKTYGTTGIPFMDLDESYDDIFDADIIFEINPPTKNDWNLADLYDFDWDNIKGSQDPFDKYPF